jgi:hypothetical protein
MKRISRQYLIEFLVAALLSFVWVAYYHYNYNMAFLNSRFINWFAFSLWTAGLFVTLRFYQWLKIKIKNLGLRLVVFWVAYFTTLLVIEYSGYNIFKIRAMTSEPALCFGLIHGTPILKVYYLIAGLIAVFFYSLFQKRIEATRAGISSKK